MYVRLAQMNEYTIYLSKVYEKTNYLPTSLKKVSHEI